MPSVRSHSKAGKKARQLLLTGNLSYVWNTGAGLAKYSWKELLHVNFISHLESCWQGNGWNPWEEKKAKTSFQIWLFPSFVQNKYWTPISYFPPSKRISSGLEFFQHFSFSLFCTSHLLSPYFSYFCTNYSKSFLLAKLQKGTKENWNSLKWLSKFHFSFCYYIFSKPNWNFGYNSFIQLKASKRKNERKWTGNKTNSRT